MPRTAHRDDDYLRDGESISVRCTMMDSAAARVCDALGDTTMVGHRPGFLLPHRDRELTRLKDEVEEAREERGRRDAVAWQNPGERAFAERMFRATDALPPRERVEAMPEARRKVAAEAWRVARWNAQERQAGFERTRDPSRPANASSGLPEPQNAASARDAADARELADRAWEEKGLVTFRLE